MSVLDAMNIPMRATASALTDQEFSDKDAYALRPLVKKLDIQNKYGKAAVEFIGQTLSDPVNYVGIGIISKGARVAANLTRKESAIMRRLNDFATTDNIPLALKRLEESVAKNGKKAATKVAEEYNRYESAIMKRLNKLETNDPSEAIKNLENTLRRSKLKNQESNMENIMTGVERSRTPVMQDVVREIPGYENKISSGVIDMMSIKGLTHPSEFRMVGKEAGKDYMLAKKLALAAYNMPRIRETYKRNLNKGE